MRFIIDAQLSRHLARKLDAAGHRAEHCFEHLDPSADDFAVAALANQLGASVMSKDADFASLARRGVLLRTFVWIRVPNVANDVLWARVDRALPDIVSAAREHARIFEVH